MEVRFEQLLEQLKKSIIQEDFRAFDPSLWLMDFYIKEGIGFKVVYENGREEFINNTRKFKRLLNKLVSEAEKDKQIKRKIEEILKS
jgi:hypothetical protein